jgi:hypothetical protein
MRRSMLLLVFPLALLLLIPILVGEERPLLEAAPQPGETGAGPCVGATVRSDLPHEVTLMEDGTSGPSQTDFDCFSWQSLVALNWAAGAKNGQPASDIPFGHTGRDDLVVWMTYKQPEEIFLPDGENPCSCDTSDAQCRETCWNTAKDLPAVCGNQGTAAEMVLTPGVDTLTGHVGAVPNVWLTDQNGSLVRSEVRLNQDLFELITAKKYYDSRNQRNNPAALVLPTGEEGGAVGAMTLKAAWRIVKKEEESRFFTVDAVIMDTKVNQLNGYPDPTGVFATCNQAGEGPCCVRRMGLVGFHIAHKVKGRPQWVWSTFEHMDNAPIQGESVDPDRKYSFFNPACGTGPQCVPNQNPRKAKIPIGIPMQIERVIQKDPGGQPLQLPAKVNNQWHGLVRGTVWENYVLVSTQWPVNPSLPKGDPEPTFLANTTIEPYNQIPDPNTPNSRPSSCIDCHSFAHGMNQKKSDFSYLFSKAQPRLGQLP